MNTARNVPQPSSRRPRLPVLASPYRAPGAGSMRRFAPAASAAPRGPLPPPARPPAPEGPAPAPVVSGDAPPPGFHGAVTAFKRRLIERTLTELGGNRTRAARALGLQRTYLLRLMREFEVHVPAGAPRRSPSPERSPPV